MRLILSLTSIAASAAAIALAVSPPVPAHAQGSGMNCYANVGGRSNCGLAANALLNRLDGEPSERHAALDARHLRQVRAVDNAIKTGHCDQAVALAQKSGDRLLASSAARLCAAPTDAGSATPAAPPT
ncbi:hypothetical protein [Phenylobacterium sp.]|uniref:hypothetical protein n=1 Tax=Phenylobacterium sp. TaxID=1871053 RepID=UPI0025D94E66|nr:hypothetical protein [Phenylobacterium sp.]